TLAPTPTVARDLEARGFSPVEVWGRGVDLDQFDPDRRRQARRDDWDVGERLAVGFVGRLAAEKRVDRLAALAARPDLRLVIVGDGPERANLEAAMPEAHFTGMLAGADLGEAMASLDLFVHTGEHETFCQTIQEAMASGVPVVAPAAGGPVDLVTPGVNGELFRPGDDADLLATVEALAADPERRRRLAAAGMASVQERTWSSVSGRLVVHYRRAIAAHQPLILAPAASSGRSAAAEDRHRGAAA
ncbi:MAG: glycosyltransferase, partial [Actinomycetota bacterium]